MHLAGEGVFVAESVFIRVHGLPVCRPIPTAEYRINDAPFSEFGLKLCSPHFPFVLIGVHRGWIKWIRISVQ